MDTEQFKADFKKAFDEFFNHGKEFPQEYVDYMNTKDGLVETFRLMNLETQKTLAMFREAEKELYRLKGP